MINSRKNRLELLAGFLSTKNIVVKFYDKIIVQMTNIYIYENLYKDILYVTRSLGFKSYFKQILIFDTAIVNKNKFPLKGQCAIEWGRFPYIGEKFTYSVNGINNTFSPICLMICGNIKEIFDIYEKNNIKTSFTEEFKLLQNKFNINYNKKNYLSHKINIIPLFEDKYYGFEIDGNRRFVLGDFTVTHNTVLSLNIISKIQKKTLIIVHKEFLMNQWIERIQQFLPKAKVGRIQGQIIDIDDKDIVLGMLQSLSMKEYPSSLFQTFGFTIIDEVHHISSEVFSNVLFKLVTRYMLGLSATMNRKDGTTYVFKLFLGDIIFKGKSDDEHDVIVRGIEYKCNDDSFNEIKYDYRGNTAYSSMITKLCEYNHRSDFILKILSDLLLENNEQQIMILAHNKNLLEYFYKGVQHRNLATVGYYVGGMKQQALKDSETKQVIIATYAMAAEALDIKTLTTLIMATPKTDIEQCVGRILRQKHNQPIVVDIVDQHDLFKRQWKKRQIFYKRENYKILYVTNNKYTPDTSKWSVLYTPKCYGKSSCVGELDNSVNVSNNTNVKIVKIVKKLTAKSRSSSDKSIAEDSDEDADEDLDNDEYKKPIEICLLGKFLK